MRDSFEVENPDAIGDLARDPRVRLSEDLMRLMGRCEAPAPSRADEVCGGVNGFHAHDCERVAA